VTGLVVNEKVNIDRKVLKKIRAMLHHLQTAGLDAATQKHLNLNREANDREKDLFLNRLEGYVNFVGQVRGKDYKLYLRFVQSVLA
jgi:RNA-directed DNA polymerase